MSGRFPWIDDASAPFDSFISLKHGTKATLPCIISYDAVYTIGAQYFTLPVGSACKQYGVNVPHNNGNSPAATGEIIIILLFTFTFSFFFLFFHRGLKLTTTHTTLATLSTLYPILLTFAHSSYYVSSSLYLRRL